MTVALSLLRTMSPVENIPDHRVIDVVDNFLPPSFVKTGMPSRNLVIFEDGSSVLNYEEPQGLVGHPMSPTMTEHLLISIRASLELKLFEGPSTWWQKVTGQHWEYQLQSVVDSQHWLCAKHAAELSDQLTLS
jgi:hypothetical protein